MKKTDPLNAILIYLKSKGYDRSSAEIFVIDFCPDDMHPNNYSKHIIKHWGRFLFDVKQEYARSNRANYKRDCTPSVRSCSPIGVTGSAH